MPVLVIIITVIIDESYCRVNSKICDMIYIAQKILTYQKRESRCIVKFSFRIYLITNF